MMGFERLRGLFVGLCFLIFLFECEGVGVSFAPKNSRMCKFSRRTNLTAPSTEKRPHRPKTELVLSYCSENLGWLTPEEISKFSAVTLYNKCLQNSNEDLAEWFPNLANANVSLQTMKNIGSCDGTYLHHILTNWDTLADFIVFYKGSFDSSCLPSYFVRAEHPDYECCPGNMFAEPLQQFQLKRYLFSHNPSVYQKVFRQFREHNGTMGSWMEEIVGETIANRLFDVVDNQHFCSKGFFATSKKLIKKYPKYLFEALHSYQKYSMEEVDHYLERTWYPLMQYQGTFWCSSG